MIMRIAVGSDHRGFEVKRRVLAQVQRMGHEAMDVGCFGEEGCDYPDFAFEVAQAVSGGKVNRGVLICGTGIGMSMAANKVPGVRAALCHDSITAEMSRRHNDANILCLSADLLGDELVERMVRIWLETDFEAGRHARRVDKITQFERRACGGTTSDAKMSNDEARMSKE